VLHEIKGGLFADIVVAAVMRTTFPLREGIYLAGSEGMPFFVILELNHERGELS
jgi:hypothetical protein